MKTSLSLLILALAFTAYCEPHPPKIEKLGTVECDLVEASPIVFKDRLYRFEYVRDRYQHNELGQAYFHFVDQGNGEKSPPFALGYHLGTAFTDGDRMYVYGVEIWGSSVVQVFSSDDLIEWASKPALLTDDWGLYNTAVAKADDRFVMAFEVGEPKEVVGNRFTIYFAESKNLLDWDILPMECVYTKEKYSACPDLHFIDGQFYMTYLEAYPGPSYNPHLLRSKDLIEWESSPFNPILSFSEEDKMIANPKLTAEERKHIAEAENINNSDVELCEWKGKTLISYSWGNQRGVEFLAEAQYNGPLREFLKGFFP
ncbi:MAG: hypothetical protein KC917_21065 [Candidatus Omnitrophica bacterium]|nr:hypothetical protein [Candidatus Omnitrophota bacterium]